MSRDEKAIEQYFQQLFIIRSEYRIIQCIQCRYAVSPSYIHGHLRDKHKKTVNQKCRKDLARYVAEKVDSIARDKQQVIYLKPNSPPVDGFPLYHNGLRCISSSDIGNECGYICRTIAGIQDHCKTMHGWKNEQKRGGNVYRKTTQTPNRLWEEG